MRRIVNDIKLRLNVLIEEEFENTATKYASYLLYNNKRLDNLYEGGGLGSSLITRALLLLDVKRSIELGVKDDLVLTNDTRLFTEYLLNPKDFAKNPQEYFIDILYRIAEERKTYNTVIDSDTIEDVVQEEEDDEYVYKYIGDWRVLSSFANEHGFVKMRQKGDHGIFRNENNVTVVIPQGRVIGRGLSYEIQKVIIEGNDSSNMWLGVDFN